MLRQYSTRRPDFPSQGFIASMYAALAEAKPKKVVVLSTIGADAAAAKFVECPWSDGGCH